MPAIILPRKDLCIEKGDMHPGAEHTDGRVALEEDDFHPGLARQPRLDLSVLIFVPHRQGVGERKPQHLSVPGGEALIGMRS